MAFLGYLIEASDRATRDDVCTLCGLCSDGIMGVVKFVIFGKGFVCDVGLREETEHGQRSVHRYRPACTLCSHM